MGEAKTPCFLAVQLGDTVAVQGNGSWWLGQVIHAEGGARCNANSLFQIACVDSGVIRTVNADAVLEILGNTPPLAWDLAATSEQQTPDPSCAAADANAGKGSTVHQQQQESSG